jgi:UDP-N-acetyl-D-mannosaminuronate dehydrogenase
MALTEDRLESYDVAVLATGHDAFPYAQIASASNRIIDTRNAFSDVSHDQDKISLLGGGRF